LNLTRPEPDEHDAHLRAALRHAPDRDVAPSAQVSERLLRAAQQAVAGPAPRAGTPAWWQLAWQAMAAPRPVWAGALGALLVASLTLRMWFDEAPPPVSTEARAPAAATPAAPEPASAAAVIVAAAPPPAPAAPPPQAQPPAPIAPPGTQQAARGTPQRTQAPPPRTTRAQAAPKSTATPSPTADTTDAAETAPPPRADRSAQPGAPQAVPPASPPAPLATSASAADAAPAVAKAAAQPAAPARSLGEARGMAAPGVMSESAMRAAATVAPLRAMLERARAPSAQADPWSWQTGDTAPRRPMDGDALALLARIDQASAGRWRADTEGADASPAPMLRWWQAERLQGSLRVEPTALRFTDAQGRRWRAELAPEAVDALRPR
jgi:hypothetical protein